MLIFPMPFGAFRPPEPAPGATAVTAAYGCKRLLYFEGYEDIRKNNSKAGGAKKKLNLVPGMEDDYSA